MRTRHLQALVASIVVAALIFVLVLTYFASSYSATVACTGEESSPEYIGYTQGTTISYVTQTRVQQISQTSSAVSGRIGSVYSTTISYTTTVTVSGSAVTLNGGYANLTCTYVK